MTDIVEPEYDRPDIDPLAEAHRRYSFMRNLFVVTVALLALAGGALGVLISGVATTTTDTNSNTHALLEISRDTKRAVNLLTDQQKAVGAVVVRVDCAFRSALQEVIVGLENQHVLAPGAIRVVCAVPTSSTTAPSNGAFRNP